MTKYELDQTTLRMGRELGKEVLADERQGLTSTPFPREPAGGLQPTKFFARPNSEAKVDSQQRSVQSAHVTGNLSGPPSPINPEAGRYKDPNIEAFKQLFNQGLYFDAMKRMTEACQSSGSGVEGDKKILHYRALRKLAELFHAWEQHRYDDSSKAFSNIRKEHLINLEVALPYEDHWVDDFVEDLKGSNHFQTLKRDAINIGRLRQREGQGLTPANRKDRLSYRYVYELLASVKRALDNGKYNEAFIRLYRAIEFAVQVKLYQKYNWPTFGRACLSPIPEKLRDEQPEIPDDTPEFYINLKNAWSMLEYYEDPLASSEHSKKLKGDLVATAKRNDNILIHGTAVKSEESILELWALTKKVTGISDDSVLVFPKLGKQPNTIMTEIDAFSQNLEEDDTATQVIAIQRAKCVQSIAGFAGGEAVVETFENITLRNWPKHQKVLIERYCERINGNVQPWANGIREYVPENITQKIELHRARPETVRETVLKEYGPPRDRWVLALIFFVVGGPIYSAHGFAFGSAQKLEDGARIVVLWLLLIFLFGLFGITYGWGVSSMIFAFIFIGSAIAGNIRAHSAVQSRFRSVEDVLVEHEKAHIKDTLNVFDNAIISLNRSLLNKH